MKSLRITILFLSILSARAGTPTVSISTNKLFVIGTNNVLAPSMTNFFTTNIYPLTNALSLAGYGGGGGLFSTPNLDTNNGLLDLATTIRPTNIAALNTISGMGLTVSNANVSFVNPSGNTATLTLQGQISGGTAQTLVSTPAGLYVGPIFVETGGDVLGITSIANSIYIDGSGNVNIDAMLSANILTNTPVTNAPYVLATNISAAGAFYGLNGGLTNANGQALVDQTITNTLNTIMRAAGTTMTNVFQNGSTNTLLMGSLANASVPVSAKYWGPQGTYSSSSGGESNYSAWLPGVHALSTIAVNANPANLSIGTNIVFNVRTNGAATGIWSTNGPTGATNSLPSSGYIVVTNCWIDVQTSVAGAGAPTGIYAQYTIY